jgi:hypothetical protein
MFHRKKIRFDVFKNADSSSVKHFIQDQMGVILTIVGGIPIFFEYFGLISSPETIPDAALKAVSITSLLICTIIILFIYSERRQLIRERKIYTAALGLLLMIAGLALLVIYTYEPSSSELVGKFESSAPYKLYLYNAKSSEILGVPRVPLEISSFWFMLSLMSFMLWGVIVIFLVFKIDSLIKKVNFSDPKPHFEKEDEELNVGTWLRPVKRVWIPVAQVMLIIFFTIILFVLFEPLIFKTPLFEKITISVRKVNFIRTVAYVSYYPILVSGSMLMITVVFNSFERQRNFYENINQLSDPFFDEIDKITDSVAQFENWFNVRELESRERFLLNDHNRDETARNAELNRLNSQESQRIFYWRTMRAKLTYYRLRIEEFAASEGRQLHASGPLIDDIFTKCMPKDNGRISKVRFESFLTLKYLKLLKYDLK